MKIVFLCLFHVILWSFAVHAQTDQSDWSDLREFSSDDYLFRVPREWEIFKDTLYGKECERKYLFLNAGKYVYPADFNRASVLVYVLFDSKTCRGKCPDIETCRKERIGDYHVPKFSPEFLSPDFYKKVKFEKFRLKSGQTAYVYGEHYKDDMINSNYNIIFFDLVLFSAKSKTCYSYSVRIQYYGDNKEFIKLFRPDEFVKKVFNHFELKE